MFHNRRSWIINRRNWKNNRRSWKHNRRIWKTNRRSRKTNRRSRKINRRSWIINRRSWEINRRSWKTNRRSWKFNRRSCWDDWCEWVLCRSNENKGSSKTPKGLQALSPGQASEASGTLGSVEGRPMRPRRGQKQRQERSNTSTEACNIPDVNPSFAIYPSLSLLLPPPGAYRTLLYKTRGVARFARLPRAVGLQPLRGFVWTLDGDPCKSN